MFASMSGRQRQARAGTSAPSTTPLSIQGGQSTLLQHLNVPELGGVSVQWKPSVVHPAPHTYLQDERTWVTCENQLVMPANTQEGTAQPLGCTRGTLFAPSTSHPL